MFQTTDALVAPLLRLNHCHLAEAEKTLLMHQKYPELIILYQTKGQHKKALELLEKHAKENDSSLKGTERTVQFTTPRQGSYGSNFEICWMGFNGGS